MALIYDNLGELVPEKTSIDSLPILLGIIQYL